jgi:holo-[acyl-carrier protein] synthase
MAPLGPVVKGHGIDVVEVDRFRTSLVRTPSMRERLFTAHELADVAKAADPVPSLAVRFAAREATMKAMGLGLGAFGFHEVWIERRLSGEPVLRVDGRAHELATERGITRWWVSLTHTSLVAVASVIAE